MEPGTITISTSTLSTWVPIIGSIIVQVIGLVWASAKFTSKVERIEEKFNDHVTANDETYVVQEKRVNELKLQRDEQIERMERDLGVRLSKVEIDQAQIKELLYHKMEELVDVVNDVKSELSELKGSMKASGQFDPPPRRPRRRRKP